MKYFILSTLVFLSLIKPLFGFPECPRGKEAKELVILYMKEVVNSKDFYIGVSTSLHTSNPSEKPVCQYNIYTSWKGLNDQGEEQVYMKHFELNEDLYLKGPPSVICTERIQYKELKRETSESLPHQEEICLEI